MATLFIAGALCVAHARTVNAVSVEFGVATSPAEVQVWLEAEDGNCDYDVYPSVDNAVVGVRASRSCFATVYLVDTAGYVHVVYPLSPYDNTYLRGGFVYRFYLSDFGFDHEFGRGVAYAFAVASPVRFTYAQYGGGVFGAGFGYQVCGDPYVAARSFYLSILPDACDVRVIGVGHARFFVREYVRYPRYLCGGWYDGGYCRSDCAIHRQYAVHAADPYRVLRPTSRFAEKTQVPTKIVQSERSVNEGRVREKSAYQGAPMAYEGRGRSDQAKVRDTSSAARRPKVVSSKNTFVQGKKDIVTMRRQLEQSSSGKDAGVRGGHETRISAEKKEPRASVAREDHQNDTSKTADGVKNVLKQTPKVAHVGSSVVKSTRASANAKIKTVEKERHGS